MSDEPFPGTLVADEVRAWVVANRGPQHVVTCAKCGQEFYSPRLKASVCYGCYYTGAIDDAEARFRPLTEALAKRLELRPTVDQTGGMTMCLRVPIGRVDDNLGYTRRWAYFGELELPHVGMGLYEVDEQGEYVEQVGDGCERYEEWPGELHCAGEPSCGWYHHDDLCETIAEWAAPIILEFATKELQT